MLAALRSAIPFDAFAWLLTDPVTCVGSSPVAEVPVIADRSNVIRTKYLTTGDRWTSLAPHAPTGIHQCVKGHVAQAPEGQGQRVDVFAQQRGR